MDDIVFIPYFVVYRLKDNPDSMDCKCFMTLFELYSFLIDEIDNIDSYRIGHSLEAYKC